MEKKDQTEQKCSKVFHIYSQQHQRDRRTYLFKQKQCSKLNVFHIYQINSGNYKSHCPETSIITTREITFLPD